MKRHINLPIFIPHLGCPHACVFCNQKKISGKTSFSIESVAEELKRDFETLDDASCEVEIAFFGGSFTGIDRTDMRTLLSLAGQYVERGRAQSIRISTRPDYIDKEILEILSAYHVTDIELGLQSMDDVVLTASKRGHTAEASRQACRMIKASGFRLVGQMMIGLPGSTLASELETAREIVALGCDAARIYPTVVLAETELCAQMEAKQYLPLTWEDAVFRTREVLEVLIEAKLPILRIGLCAAEQLCEPGAIRGGAYHSAFGEVVYSEIYAKRIRDVLEAGGLREQIAGRTLVISVPVGESSKVAGHKQANKRLLQNEYNVKNVKIIENSSLICYNIKIDIR